MARGFGGLPSSSLSRRLRPSSKFLLCSAPSQLAMPFTSTGLDRGSLHSAVSEGLAWTSAMEDRGRFFVSSTPLGVAETASTFSNTFRLGRKKGEAIGSKDRRCLSSRRIRGRDGDPSCSSLSPEIPSAFQSFHPSSSLPTTSPKVSQHGDRVHAFSPHPFSPSESIVSSSATFGPEEVDRLRTTHHFLRAHRPRFSGGKLKKHLKPLGPASRHL